MVLRGPVSLWHIAGILCPDQKVRTRMSTATTQPMVFNDNYWGPPRERLPELKLKSNTQTKPSPLTYSHTIGRGEQTGQGFRYPVALAINPRTGLMYVANRSYEYRIELKRISILTVDEHFVGQFSTGGFGDGQIFWPRGLAVDKEDKVYLTDEWLQRVSIFSADGDYLGKWGTAGSGDGEINRPAGIAFDSQDNLFVVDGSNHRIQSSLRTAGSWPSGVALAVAMVSSTTPGESRSMPRTMCTSPTGATTGFRSSAPKASS
jgi:DNA-binding beta-propeller fold protein YncE